MPCDSWIAEHFSHRGLDAERQRAVVPGGHSLQRCGPMREMLLFTSLKVRTFLMIFGCCSRLAAVTDSSEFYVLYGSRRNNPRHSLQRCGPMREMLLFTSLKVGNNKFDSSRFCGCRCEQRQPQKRPGIRLLAGKKPCLPLL